MPGATMVGKDSPKFMLDLDRVLECSHNEAFREYLEGKLDEEHPGWPLLIKRLKKIEEKMEKYSIEIGVVPTISHHRDNDYEIPLIVWKDFYQAYEEGDFSKFGKAWKEIVQEEEKKVLAQEGRIIDGKPAKSLLNEDGFKIASEVTRIKVEPSPFSISVESSSSFTCPPEGDVRFYQWVTLLSNNGGKVGAFIDVNVMDDLLVGPISEAFNGMEKELLPKDCLIKDSFVKQCIPSSSKTTLAVFHDLLTRKEWKDEREFLEDQLLDKMTKEEIKNVKIEIPSMVRGGDFKIHISGRNPDKYDKFLEFINIAAKDLNPRLEWGE